MKCRHLCVVLVALALCAPLSARAQSGINLSWDDCGAFGTDLKTFACNSNSGVDLLVVSAAVSPALPQVDGVEVVVDLATSGTTLSPWWHLESGGCRPLSLTGRQDFTQFSNCYDLWAGSAAQGVNYAPALNSVPNTARIRGVAAIPGSTATPDGTEMYLFGFTIGHQKTTGTGACSGCSESACFVLERVQLTQTPGTGDVTLTNMLLRNSVGWKCPGFAVTDSPAPCMISCPVPAHRKSWGTIQSLYR